MRNFKLLLLFVIPLFFVSSCAHKQIRRMDSSEIKDLSGRWNDTDSRLTAQKVIAECLESPWYNRHKSETGKNPVVIVGRIVNKSHEHINTETFINDLEKSLINSGEVDFVANNATREQVRAERRSMQDWSNPDTVKRMRNETGADYMLVGSINTIIDKEGKETVKFYQIDLKLLQLETNKIVWIGGKKIKKYIKKDSISW